MILRPFPCDAGRPGEPQETVFSNRVSRMAFPVPVLLAWGGIELVRYLYGRIARASCFERRIVC